ncbi:putative transport protein [Anaplasma centrale str. Israel]|uniref:Putative transport protein n=1 Tax=Anaplasma centrale (strain Israel) TaxID=574556 RepID=D1AS52_ANACI|nr:putative transport protein [Anaplasma centrale str. Israel]
MIIAGFITVCSCSFLLFGRPAFSESQRDFVLIGSGSMTNVYYSIGGGVCKFVVLGHGKANKPGQLICSTSTTAGSVYNLNSMRRGTMDIGVAQSDIGYHAYTGDDIYSGIPPMDSLRLLASMHKEYFTIVVRKDSNIKSIDDIKGKRINVGAPGTGVRTAVISLLKTKGWTIKDFLVASDLKASEQVQALCDGKIDVITDFVGHPNAGMQEASATCDAVALSLDDALIAELVEKYPYYAAGVIPGNTYKSNPQDVKTISVRASIYATTALSDEIAYAVVKSVASNIDRFRELSGALRKLTLKDLVTSGSAVPLHNGAARFYEEIGMLH